ncbi:DUF937 domain-containing protein [Thermomonas flagellata]|uniref:DUF937 domain-containing protein n=1 Tax=Thermomonas flagellata TaxID=2888524 RepID=UPI001F050042|nr:DUF937 domain-containing protein [Thermomonas flagellata]
MASLSDDLLAQLTGPALGQISRQLGADPAQTSTAIGAALPMLLGALGRDHAGAGGIAEVLGAVLGGQASPQTDGQGQLGHIFGDRLPRAEAGLGQASGLGRDQAGRLLAILAPIVLAYLGRRMFAGGSAGPHALGQLLGQEQQQLAERGNPGLALLGQVLDQDGDGQFGLDDVLRLGGRLFGAGR